MSTRVTTDAIIDDLAQRQHGVVHRRQLLAAGVTAKQITGRISRGRLIAFSNGVLAVRGHPATHLRQYKAAELAIPDATVFGLAAAHLQSLDATRSAAPEIVVHPGASHRCGFARVHRRTDVHATSVSGIRVTTVPQTLVDITNRLRSTKLEDTWTGALIRGRTTLERLTDRVEAAEAQRLAHRGLARAMLDSLVKGAELAESELETLLVDLVRQVPGIPEIEPQIALPWWKAGRGRGDVGVPSWRLVLEADGRAWHARLKDFDRDRERDNLAVANGYVVLRFSAVHLRQQPESVIELIQDTGRHRSAA